MVFFFCKLEAIGNLSFSQGEWTNATDLILLCGLCANEVSWEQWMGSCFSYSSVLLLLNTHLKSTCLLTYFGEWLIVEHLI